MRIPSNHCPRTLGRYSFSLVAEAFHQEIPKGYLYFAMAFSVFVELVNQRVRRQAPVRLKKAYTN